MEGERECVCECVNGRERERGGGGLVYKMEIYDRDTGASFSLHTGNNYAIISFACHR